MRLAIAGEYKRFGYSDPEVIDLIQSLKATLTMVSAGAKFKALTPREQQIANQSRNMAIVYRIAS